MDMVFLVVVIGFLVVVAILSVFRLRKGGPGPQMNWIPKSLRPKANESYEKHGWQKPFNDDGSRNQDRGAI